MLRVLVKGDGENKLRLENEKLRVDYDKYVQLIKWLEIKNKIENEKTHNDIKNTFIVLNNYKSLYANQVKVVNELQGTMRSNQNEQLNEIKRLAGPDVIDKRIEDAQKEGQTSDIERAALGQQHFSEMEELKRKIEDLEMDLGIKSEDPEELVPLNPSKERLNELQGTIRSNQNEQLNDIKRRTGSDDIDKRIEDAQKEGQTSDIESTALEQMEDLEELKEKLQDLEMDHDTKITDQDLENFVQLTNSTKERLNELDEMIRSNQNKKRNDIKRRTGSDDIDKRIRNAQKKGQTSDIERAALEQQHTLEIEELKRKIEDLEMNLGIKSKGEDLEELVQLNETKERLEVMNIEMNKYRLLYLNEVKTSNDLKEKLRLNETQHLDEIKRLAEPGFAINDILESYQKRMEDAHTDAIDNEKRKFDIEMTTVKKKHAVAMEMLETKRDSYMTQAIIQREIDQKRSNDTDNHPLLLAIENLRHSETFDLPMLEDIQKEALILIDSGMVSIAYSGVLKKALNKLNKDISANNTTSEIIKDRDFWRDAFHALDKDCNDTIHDLKVDFKLLLAKYLPIPVDMTELDPTRVSLPSSPKSENLEMHKRNEEMKMELKKWHPVHDNEMDILNKSKDIVTEMTKYIDNLETRVTASSKFIHNLETRIEQPLPVSAESPPGTPPTGVPSHEVPPLSTSALLRIY